STRSAVAFARQEGRARLVEQSGRDAMGHRGRQEGGDGGHRLVLVGFVIAHMLGNLKIFLGAETIDAYAVSLRTMREPLFPYCLVLWTVRIVFLLCVALDITAVVQLTAAEAVIVSRQ